MKNTKTINVTKEVIEQARIEARDNPLGGCMVAIAAKQAFNTSQVTCGFSTIRIDGEPFDLPDYVSDLIATFMCGFEVEPFSFELTN
jgi:hypothetical protein